MVQISLSLLFVVAAATVVPTLAHPYRHASHEDTNNAGSAFSRRFYGGDSIVVTRDVAVDLQRREPNWRHPLRTWSDHNKVNEITKAAHEKAKADILQEHLRKDGLSGTALAERSFDDFDLEARDFEEEY